MKAKALWVLTPVFITGFGIGIGSLKYLDHKMLDSCAKTQNVYACKFQAIPAIPPTVIIKPADILPPPVMDKKKV